MALTQPDRELLEACLNRQPQAWQKFVSRFLPLFVHAVRHTADAHSYRLSPDDLDEICGEILTAMVADDFRVLRRFRRKSSLATYLAVIARRVAVRDVARRRKENSFRDTTSEVVQNQKANGKPVEDLLISREQAEELLNMLSDREAAVVRMRFLEEKSYEQISSELNLNPDSIGPILNRIKEYLRRMQK
ncbi:MAG: sigma-70 family RNA polymerase sigma factor [Planctomycetaceae bacterium]|nr:sigma-70 family RNA polymerase sigma factor [Planctomycetaceae bacterium]